MLIQESSRYHAFPVIGDNSNARRWAIDRPVTPANMPIPNAFWYVNEQVRLDNVVILDIDTKSNPADLFTKNLGREILRLIDWICGYGGRILPR